MTLLPAKNKTLLHDCMLHFLAVASCLCMALTTSHRYLSQFDFADESDRVKSRDGQIWVMRARGQNGLV